MRAIHERYEIEENGKVKWNYDKRHALEFHEWILLCLAVALVARLYV